MTHSWHENAYTYGLWPHIDPLLAHHLHGLAPWEWLNDWGNILCRIGATLGAEYLRVAPTVWVHRSAEVAADATILGPTVVCEGAEVRPAAYLRGDVWVGAHCVVGHATEVKHSLLMAYAAAPHFNYVGDSVLGSGAHLGAGAILSNLRHDGLPVTVRLAADVYPTGRRKMGALVGEGAEVGCGAVLNPGVVLAAGAVVHPLRSVTGFVGGAM